MKKYLITSLRAFVMVMLLISSTVLPVTIAPDLALAATSSPDSSLKSRTFDFFDDGVDDAVTIDGIVVTLNTDGVERFHSTSTRDVIGYKSGGKYTFNFSQPISSFTADLSYLANFENVTNFSIPPSSVTGDLVTTGSPIASVTTSNKGDSGKGSIIWTGLNTSEISLTLNPNAPGAIAFDSFEFKVAEETAQTPVVNPTEPQTGVAWTDWTTISSDRKTATGSIVTGSHTITVTSISDSTHTSYSEIDDDVNKHWGPKAVYVSPEVDSPPSNNDLLTLFHAGTVTITFSEPVRDPLLALLSWNSNTTDFGVPIEVLSQGAGDRSFNINGDGDGFVSNRGEAQGVIRLPGIYKSITFTHTRENWHGFTVGILGVPTIVNIDPTQNYDSSTAVTRNLPAGEYKVEVIGTAQGGQFDAWSRKCNCKWDTYYSRRLGSSGPKKIGNPNKYNSKAEALANRVPSTSFTLTDETDVKFYTYSTSAADNIGGVSMQVEGNGIKQSVDLDATQNVNKEHAEICSLPAGDYTVTLLGTAEGGKYDAWSSTCSKKWRHAYKIRGDAKVTVSETGVYGNASEAFAHRPATETFRLKAPGEVKFYTYSASPENDCGGVSLNVTRIGS